MEELDLSKELQDFYEKNKDNKRLLSNNEIRKLLTSFWTTRTSIKGWDTSTISSLLIRSSLILPFL